MYEQRFRQKPGRSARRPGDFSAFDAARAGAEATIGDQEKKAKHLRNFPFYVEGDEVFAKAKADALEADLQRLVGGGLVEQVNKYDTNPANNPQAPAHLRG